MPDAMSLIAADDEQAIPPPAPQPWQRLLAQIDAGLHQLAAHPARSVVLLPYAQLLPLAAQWWAAQFPDAFAPRFETTRTWAGREGFFTPGPHDVSFDHGRDLLTAAALLEAAGLGAQHRLLAAPLAEQAAQLGQVAASLPPAMRPDWMQAARAALPVVGPGPLALEAALANIAVAWAGGSDYASDVLFSRRVGNALDALVIVPGLLPDALADHLAEHYTAKALRLPLVQDGPPAQPALHACANAEDEAERAAACVLRHIAAGRTPVALASGDRLLLRRIGALLATRGVRQGQQLHDETGWTLSTTHAAAQFMAALQACAPQASTDDALNWIKLAPALDGTAARKLEHQLRQHTVRGWAQAARMTQDSPLTQRIEALRQPMAEPRPLRNWLASARTLLEGCGLWQALAADAAGSQLIATLGLADDPGASAGGDWRHHPAAQRRMSLGGFRHWAAQALEAASYRPHRPARAPLVTVLPLNQLLGRPFAALVLPGADEKHLPLAPDPAGPWTPAQRQALYLPGRQALQTAQAEAWALALRVPAVDLLWRLADDSGEPLLPSPFVQALQLAPAAPALAADPRPPRPIAPAPTAPPAPLGNSLPAQPLSASSYDMLRACPYRFFALRQLGLQSAGELDVDLGKRDWGVWLHATLRHFHEALQANPQADAAARQALMQAAAEQATQDMGAALEPSEFMPFAAAWPALRDAYLQWQAAHEAQGSQFAAAEQRFDNVPRGNLLLRGQIDRIDHSQPDGATWLIDYKTESPTRTKDRLKAGNEDTQLPFYALLSAAAAPRAAYLNLSEREPPTLHEVNNLPQLAAQLYEGMCADMARIAQGAPLPALGQGSVCDWCDARGLCRKDWWEK